VDPIRPNPQPSSHVTPTPRPTPAPTESPDPITPDEPTEGRQCAKQFLKNTSNYGPKQIYGGSTGLFVRETLCPGAQGIASELVTPYFKTVNGEEQPWIYYGLNDSHHDIEAGLAFEKGGVDGKTARWIPYLRYAKHFIYNEDFTIATGSRISMKAIYYPGEVQLYVDGQLVGKMPVSLNSSTIAIRRMISIALPYFNGNTRTGSLNDVIWENTRVTRDNGNTFTPFRNETLTGSEYDGVWYGSVLWPSERISVQGTGDFEIMSINNSR